MYTSLSLDTGPVCDISAYLYQVAPGSISKPQLIGVQVQGVRRGIDWGRVD